MSEKFFVEKQPAAVLKHELLSRYLPVYVRKTGSTSRNNRVSYIDCYAGPGQYEDGSVGSPGVAIETANVVRGATDRVDGFFIERERDSVIALQHYLEDQGLDWPVFHGEVQDELPGLLDRIHPDTALFVFLDPFGLGIPMDLLGQILQRSGPVRYGYRTKGAATEVLLNFSFPGLRRNAGHLTSTSKHPRYVKSRGTILANLDATMGGDWWRDIWLSEDDEREDLILREYLRRVQEQGEGWGWWSIPVADRWDGSPSYNLIQLTQHPDGRWEFGEALSNALEPYRAACFARAGQMDLEPLTDREATWVADLKQNIASMLTAGKPFVVQDRLPEICGDHLGLVRTTHIRKAIKQLYKEGGTATTGVGDVQRMRIEPPS